MQRLIHHSLFGWKAPINPTFEVGIRLYDDSPIIFILLYCTDQVWVEAGQIASGIYRSPSPPQVGAFLIIWGNESSQNNDSIHI
jgi:hypothetical protein